MCVLVHSLYIALFVWAQVDALAWLNLASVLTHCVAFWLSRTDCHVRAASLVLIAEITVHAIAATVVIGWEAGFHYLMLPVVPVAMLSSSEHRVTKNAIALCLSAIYLAWTAGVTPTHRSTRWTTPCWTCCATRTSSRCCWPSSSSRAATTTW